MNPLRPCFRSPLILIESVAFGFFFFFAAWLVKLMIYTPLRHTSLPPLSPPPLLLEFGVETGEGAEFGSLASSSFLKIFSIFGFFYLFWGLERDLHVAFG